MTDAPDYYRELGVSRDATSDEIRSAYKKLAKKYHPDVNSEPGAEEKFKRINEAYEILGDEEKRRVYDNYRSSYGHSDTGTFRNQRNSPENGTRYHYSTDGTTSNIDWDSVIEAMRSLNNSRSTIFDFGDMIWNNVTSSNANANNRTRTNDPDATDLECNIKVPLKTMINGGTRRIAVNIDGKKTNINIRIPRESGTSTKLKLKNMGRYKRDGSRTDLIVNVSAIIPSGVEIHGKDIITSIDIPFTIAVCGGSVNVTLENGRKIKLKIPYGTKSGDKFSIDNNGIDHDGKTILSANITIPPLDAEGRNKIRELKEYLDAKNKHGMQD